MVACHGFHMRPLLTLSFSLMIALPRDRWVACWDGWVECFGALVTCTNDCIEGCDATSCGWAASSVTSHLDITNLNNKTKT